MVRYKASCRDDCHYNNGWEIDPTPSKRGDKIEGECISRRDWNILRAKMLIVLRPSLYH